jgi:uncharacterized membrane protein
MICRFCLVFCISFFSLFPTQAIAVTSESNLPQLIGVLFYKTDCPDCGEVSGKIIPDALEKSGKSWDILAVNNSTPEGGQFFLEMLVKRNLPLSMKMPVLVTQKNIWSGREEIQKNIGRLLSAEPPVFSLDPFQNGELIVQSANKADSNVFSPAFWITKGSKPIQAGLLATFSRNFQKDKTANGLAVLVLLALIATLLYIVITVVKQNTYPVSNIPGFYPLLCFIAFLLAGYLFYSGVTQNELSCGPVGECNVVQQSKYSKIFNLIPISLLGMIAYSFCIVFWTAGRISSAIIKNLFTISAWGISVVAVCFFVYLTFLEPFVIGATCMWCITTAVITIISALIATKPALTAFQAK